MSIRHQRRRPGVLTGMAGALWVLAAVSLPRAATPLRVLYASPDITVQTPEAIRVDDEDILWLEVDSLARLAAIGPLPASCAIDAAHEIDTTGTWLLSFDTWVELPDGIRAGPADIVRYADEIYSIWQSAADMGIPAGSNLDALTVDAQGRLLLSFDTSLQLGGVVANDEDLILFEEGDRQIEFDGSSAGVAAGLDLDAVQLLPDGKRLLLSFDGTGVVEGVVFLGRDVLEYDPASDDWEMAWENPFGSQTAADLDALSARAMDGDGDGLDYGEDCDDLDATVWALPGESLGLELQRLEGLPDGTLLTWSPPELPGGTTVAYDALRSTGPFTFQAPTATCLVAGSAQRETLDLGLPPPGTGAYYLIRAVNLCGDGTLGEERSGRSCP